MRVREKKRSARWDGQSKEPRKGMGRKELVARIFRKQGGHAFTILAAEDCGTDGYGHFKTSHCSMHQCTCTRGYRGDWRRGGEGRGVKMYVLLYLPIRCLCCKKFFLACLKICIFPRHVSICAWPFQPDFLLLCHCRFPKEMEGWGEGAVRNEKRRKGKVVRKKVAKLNRSTCRETVVSSVTLMRIAGAES